MACADLAGVCSGLCERGAACWFAHGRDELRHPHKHASRQEVRQSFLQLCVPAYVRASCYLTGFCGTIALAHVLSVANQLSISFCWWNESMLSGLQAHNPAPSNSGSNEVQEQCPDEALFKTRMCAYFQQGRCQRGTACTFAHDPAELQQFDRARRGSVQTVKATSSAHATLSQALLCSLQSPARAQHAHVLPCSMQTCFLCKILACTNHHIHTFCCTGC